MSYEQLTVAEAGLIDAIRDAIEYNPCVYYDDIAQGASITKHHVMNGLILIRKAFAYGTIDWTVPHVQRGQSVTGETRYRIVERGQTQLLDPDDDEAIREGFRQTLLTQASMGENEGEAMKAIVALIPDPKVRHHAKRWVNTMLYCAQEARATADLMA